MLSVVLICSVLASLAVGVLIAYGICLSMFKVFRVHSMQAAQARAAAREAAKASVVGTLALD